MKKVVKKYFIIVIIIILFILRLAIVHNDKFTSVINRINNGPHRDCVCECMEINIVDTILISSIKDKNEFWIKTLVNLGSNINAPNYDKLHPIECALRVKSDYKIINFLIDSGAELNSYNGKSIFSLSTAIRYKNNAEVIKLLIKNGANVNEKAWQGRTPLIVAAKNSDKKNIIEILKSLLKSNVDIKIQDNEGKTALDYAKEKGNKEIIKLLEDAMGKEKQKPVTINTGEVILNK